MEIDSDQMDLLKQRRFRDHVCHTFCKMTRKLKHQTRKNALKNILKFMFQGENASDYTETIYRAKRTQRLWLTKPLLKLIYHIDSLKI